MQIDINKQILDDFKKFITWKCFEKSDTEIVNELLKKELYKEGILPHTQVHDELDISVTDPDQCEKIMKIMSEELNEVKGNTRIKLLEGERVLRVDQ